MMGDVMQRTAGLRRPGAAALDLAYVAAGFTDGFFETGLSALGCGGRLAAGHRSRWPGRQLHGRGRFLEQKECLAGNPRIYGQLVHPGQIQQVCQRCTPGTLIDANCCREKTESVLMAVHQGPAQPLRPGLAERHPGRACTWRNARLTPYRMGGPCQPQ
jgi:hypothetical protein